MKRISTAIGIFAGAAFLLTSFSIRQNPQDPPNGKKAEKHIEMVKIDDNGKKTELDTVIRGTQVFVWNGDTIGAKDDLKWLGKVDFDTDSIHKNFERRFEYKIDNDGEGKMTIMKMGKDGGHAMFMPREPRAPQAPRMMVFRDHKRGNVIDLSDPGIISFDKKVRKDGTEKITIVRKTPKDGEMEENENIFIGGDLEHPSMMHSEFPGQAKKIRILKSDDGKVEVIENDGAWNSISDDENVKVIEADGKKIRIKETIENGEKKVEVEVENKK